MEGLWKLQPYRFNSVLLINKILILTGSYKLGIRKPHPNDRTMGNQNSTPDKDKDKDREQDEKGTEKEKELLRSIPRHERHRSKSITPSLLPPTETKVNAEQTHNNNEPKLSTEISFESIPPSINTGYPGQTAPLKERRTSKTITAKDVVETAKDMNLKNLPRPTEEEIRKGAEEIEATPKFETMKAPSQTSLVDEDEQREADKSGHFHSKRRVMIRTDTGASNT